MAKLIKSKMTSLGLVEVVQGSDGWYQLIVNGSIKQQSQDLKYILSEYDCIS
ncbi:MAG: hypothetical protein IKN95_11380 [Lachnospiraceae bacterium]|nr:hypothetical protein [Lachnospiraceae bacterium]